jgi:hypothetical protein
MFHRKCETAISALQAESAKLAQELQQEAATIAELRADIKTRDQDIIQQAKQIAIALADRKRLHDALLQIARVTEEADLGVIGILATLSDEYRSTHALPRIRILLKLHYLEPRCVAIFSQMLADLPSRLATTCGNRILNPIVTVNMSFAIIDARFRGDFCEACASVYDVVNCAPRLLCARIVAQDMSERAMAIRYDAAR